MGQYTQSIREILQVNKTPQEQLTQTSDVYDVAMRCLFDNAPLTYISQEHRMRFVTGFTLHFMNDELALETLPLWKIALNEKIYNSYTYINKIFESLDKEVFANYQVKNIESEGTNSGEKTGGGTVSNVRNDDTTTTTSDDVTHSETSTDVLTGTLAGTGTIGNARTGTDTLEQTGTSELAHTGDQVTTGTNEQDTDNTGHTDNDHNVIQINSDTPQGSLSNLRSPGGNAKGTGVGYANGQTYNYMSSASEVDESNVQTDNTNQHTEGTDSSTTTFDDANTETRNLTDETTYNSTITETRNTLDTTNRSDTINKTGADNRDVVTSVDGEVTETQTRNTLDTETGSHSNSTDEIDYSINMEMLYKSMPLLNKVWEVFDDLFMLIF